MKRIISNIRCFAAGHIKLVIVLALAAGVLTTPSTASASPIVGNLVLSGHLTEVIAVNGTVIDFDFTGGVSNGFPPVATSGTVDGTGDSALFDIAQASTGSFAALIGTTTTVHDLDSTRQPVGQTVGVGLPLANFITFAAQPGWSISLTQLLPGAFTAANCAGVPAAGQTCTPANSPFNLSNIAGNQVNVSFAFLGTASDGLGNTTSISGTFGTTFSNTNLQAIVAAIIAGQTVVTSGSATIAATAIPEPGSNALFLIGATLLLAGTFASRRRNG